MTEVSQNRPKGLDLQQGQIDLDAHYHKIGIPAVNAAAHAMRSRQVQQTDHTTSQQTAHMFSFED